MVSIPYERERAFQASAANNQPLGIAGTVSIPYERERAFQANAGDVMRMANKFQFPTNGKGLFKWEHVPMEDYESMFQFPTNGKGLFKCKTSFSGWRF